MLDPKPEIFRIEQLVTNVKLGDIKLPKFQRPFVWKRSDILSLLDSIYKGYPIGSILLWFTKEHLASERKIGDLEIDERPDEYPTHYLLDGQQRLSSLCGALYWQGSDKKSMWNIYFDLEKEEFLYLKDEIKPEYFPLNKLLDTFSFIDQCKTFETHPRKIEYEKNARRLLNAIKDYKVAAVKIGEMSIDEVAPIFERINSTGRQLTMVDLMRAATWSGGFDLNDTICKVRETLEAKNFDGVEESHILRNISAAAGYGIHKEGIDKLRDCTSEQLQFAAADCVNAHRLAVDFLTDELPITSYGYVPYGLQLTLLVELFRICSTPNIIQREKIKKWFWKGSISRHFGFANTGQITRDLSNIRSFAKGQTDELIIDREVNYDNFVWDNFSLNKASSKSFALLLAQNKPKSLMDGSPINTYQALSTVNKHEFHHIFPKAFLKASGIAPEKIDLHPNICLLSLGNNRAISKSRPSLYFKKIKEDLGNRLEEILSSNYISMEAFEAGLHEDYEQFIKLRSETLINAAQRLCK